MKERGTTISLFIIISLIVQSVSAQSLVYHSDLEKSVLSRLQFHDGRDYIRYFLASDSNANHEFYNELIAELDRFEDKVSRKKQKRDDNEFLDYLFYKVHRKYLKNYRQYSSFYTMMNKGYYDCLSATTLYAYLLNHFGYNFDVIETNYHIYMVVHLSQGKILFESTDPLAGLIYDQDEIHELVNNYKKAAVADENLYYQFTFNLENKVSMRELIGLLYYNMAVKSFNTQNLQNAVSYWLKASIFYNSKRMEAIEELLVEKNLISETFRQTAPVAFSQGNGN